jgi:hypothetical protein
MEAINLHKQMAMGKGYPTSVATGKDPAPTPAQPKADYKTMPKMKVEKVKGEGNK